MHKAIGNEIRTRIFFRRNIEEIIKQSDEICLDFSGVTFITRSVADEIYNIQLDFPKIDIINLHGEAKKMYEVVKRSRLAPRNVSEKVRFHSVRLSNIDETIRYFEHLRQ